MFTRICHIPNIKALRLLVSEKNFEVCHFWPQWHHIDKLGRHSSLHSVFREDEFWSCSSLFLYSKLWPQGQFWPKEPIRSTNLVEVYREILHTKYQSSMPSIFREEEFWSFCSYMYIWTCDHRGGASFNPMGIILNKLCKSPLENAKYQISKVYAFQFQRRSIWSFTSFFLCSNLWPPGRGHFWPHFQSFPIQNSVSESPLQFKIKRDKLCRQKKITQNQQIQFHASLITLIFIENGPKSLYMYM